ncbi:MAG: hybrid sensor histidine kinase/response regulator [Gammaproteobacteria bacterium]|nr:hybrid sensor histidine kinase/response regulator [Gammaproteobacteria bacterium]
MENFSAQEGPAVHDRVLLEQVRACYQHTLGVMAGGPLSVPLLIFLLWSYVDSALLIGWGLVTLACHMLGGAILHFGFRRDPHPERHLRKWNRALYLLAAALGACWGSIGALFFSPDFMTVQLVLYLWIFGAAALGSLGLVALHQGYWAFTMPLLIPIFIKSSLQTEGLYAGLAAATVIYFVFLAHFSKNNHATLVDFLRTRFANIDLAQQLARKNQIVEQASRAKSQFFAAASHDLRQPLHAQVLFVAELKARITDPGSREIISYMEASIDSMRAMYNQMLDISRLDAGVVERRDEVFQVSRVLSRLKLEFDSQMAQKGLRFRAVPCRYHIRSDPMLLENVLRNFLSNALRYTHSGGVLIGCRYRQGRLAIEVRDSGLGIPEDQQKNIFDEFIQLSNPERDREKGLGLGLAIVKRLAKLLDHPVSLHSFPGQGTIFSITAPLVRFVSQQPQTSIETLTTVDLSGMAVLIIDDDAAILRATDSLLTRWGCVTLTAASEHQALRRLAETGFHPDVVIADYRLRENKTGLQAVARIREYLARPVAAIIITGDTAPERPREASLSGFRLMHKPIQPDLLHELLGEIRS